MIRAHVQRAHQSLNFARNSRPFLRFNTALAYPRLRCCAFAFLPRAKSWRSPPWAEPHEPPAVEFAGFLLWLAFTWQSISGARLCGPLHVLAQACCMLRQQCCRSACDSFFTEGVGLSGCDLWGVGERASSSRMIRLRLKPYYVQEPLPCLPAILPKASHRKCWNRIIPFEAN